MKMQIDNSAMSYPDKIYVKVEIPDNVTELELHQLFSRNIHSYWLQALADNIHQLNCLEKLDLTRGNIDDDKLKIVAQMVQRCPSLSELYLDESCGSNPQAPGYCALLESIRKKEGSVVTLHFIKSDAMALRM